MFAIYVFWGRRSIFVPICCNFCMVCMFLRLVLANPLHYFSLRDINLTLGLLPSMRHVVWRNSVGVESSKLGLNRRVRIFFTRVFFGCCALLTSYNNSETAVYGYDPALFWVLLVLSCSLLHSRF